MGKFYLNVEFKNGNYYLYDIVEIALIAEESGNDFHSYVSPTLYRKECSS